MLGDFFATHIAEAVVSRDSAKVSTVKKIWSKHVCSGSELRKEMRLFKAVAGKRLSNKQVAYDLLCKVKKTACDLNKEKLEREKTALIREVVSTLGESFFHLGIKNYQELASIQILLNYCTSNTLRESVINPAMAELEDKVLGFMTEIQVDSDDGRSLDEVLAQTEKDVDGLIVNIMREKMNKKFSPKLNENQKTILQQYVFDGDDNSEQLKKTLTTLREDTLHLITEELASKKPSKTEKDKLMEIEGLLKEDYKNVSSLDETSIAFYMTVSKLYDELKDEK